MALAFFVAFRFAIAIVRGEPTCLGWWRAEKRISASRVALNANTLTDS